MRKDRVFGWAVSAGLHAIVLLGAGLVAVKIPGGIALGDWSEEVSYALSLRERPSGPWSPQFTIRDAAVPPPEPSESGLLPTSQVLQDDWHPGCPMCDEELPPWYPCPVCSAKRPSLNRFDSSASRITDASLKQAGTRRSGLRGYGVGQLDWPPRELCGFDLINR